MSATASTATTTRVALRRARDRGRSSARTTRPRLVVGMQRRVQGDAVPVAGACLDGAGVGVAQEQQAVLARELACLDDLAVRQGDLGARSQVEAGLNHAVVPEGDAQAGLGPEQ